MNNTLDSFESALLLELRQHVAEHPAPEPVRVRRPRRRLRLAAVGATGVAASVVAVFGLGSGGGSPAYAVDENAAGDVTVTVHRLDDADGLEKALSGKGIDAEVSYDADGSDGTFSISSEDGSADQTPRGEGGLTQGDEGNGPTTTGPPAIADACGPVEPPPASLARDGDDWVLTIPAGSPLHDRHVAIGTDASGALSVQYAANVPGAYCGVMSSGAPR